MKMKDLHIEMTDIQPMIGMSLGQIEDMFKELSDRYGHDAVLADINIRKETVQLELPFNPTYGT